MNFSMSFRRIAGRVVTIVLWLLGAAFVVAGLNLYDVYLTNIRSWTAATILLGACLAVALLVMRGFWSCKGFAGKLLILLWCLPPVAMATATAIMQRHKYRTLHAEGPMALELGRRFVVGYSSYDQVAPLVSKGLVGGIFINQRNLKGRSAEALRSEIAGLQELRRAKNLPPLIVAADQEGGIVSHLSPPLTALPALATLAALPADERAQKAEDFGRLHGLELSGLGVTLNLAPVIDLKPGWSRNRFDFHSLIHQRAISADPAVTADVATDYLRGLQTAGVTGTVKHFPGLGRIRADTHHFRASLNAPVADLEASDWRPFRTTLAQPGAWLMVGHVAVAAIDPARAASHSTEVIEGLIRGKWGYDGIVMTDDLVMGPIYQYGICAATVEALNAGVDLLLVAYDGRQFYRIFDCALAASARGAVDRTVMAKAIARLDARARPATQAAASAR
jgi:beta-N-acetylhexosaminidase